MYKREFHSRLYTFWKADPLIKHQCKICGESFILSSFTKHLSKHSIDLEYYALRYLDIKKGYCLKCGVKTKFLSLTKLYAKFCSKSCANSFNSGLSNETKLKKYGSKNNIKKNKETCLVKYGVDNIFKDPICRARYKDKRITSIRETCRVKYGEDWIPYVEKDHNIGKRRETCLKRYGKSAFESSLEYKKRKDEIVSKIWETKKKNKTTNTSKLEKHVLDFLEKNYGKVICNYKTEQYPFNCDYYIQSLDLYIELQGFFTHGGKSYTGSKEDKLIREKWASKSGSFYKNALNVWTNMDVKKRKIAKRNNLKFLEIFEYTDLDFIKVQIERVTRGISLKYTKDELKNEFNNITTKLGTLNTRPTHNKLVKHFQPHIYQKENEIYIKDPIKRRLLLENRIRYLGKKEYELTPREILSGFKISGIEKGFSFFSPLWAKYFVDTYKVKSVLDPFGGWGHRMLGIASIEGVSYIYNDISEKTFSGCKRMAEFLGLKNICFYNNSANKLQGLTYDSIFSCPPYFELEKYKDSIGDYSKIFKETFENLKAPVVGLVLKENMESFFIGLLGEYTDKKVLNKSINHFISDKVHNEFLYVWRTNESDKN